MASLRPGGENRYEKRGKAERAKRERRRSESESSSSRGGQGRSSSDAGSSQKEQEAKSVFDTVKDWFNGEDELDEKEEEQLVEDWYSFTGVPDDILGDVAKSEAMKMQSNFALGGVLPPGLAGKAMGVGMEGMTGDVYPEDMDENLPGAVRRSLERQYEEQKGFGDYVASAADIAGTGMSLMGMPAGKLLNVGAGAYKAAQVPDALSGFNERMGTAATIPERRYEPHEGGSQSERPRSTSPATPMMPSRPYILPQGITLDPDELEGLFSDPIFKSIL